MHDSQAAAKPGGIAAVSEGVVLYELDDEPLAESKPRQPGSASRIGFPVLGNFDSFSTLAWKSACGKPQRFFASRQHYATLLLLVLITIARRPIS